MAKQRHHHHLIKPKSLIPRSFRPPSSAVRISPNNSMPNSMNSFPRQDKLLSNKEEQLSLTSSMTVNSSRTCLNQDVLDSHLNSLETGDILLYRTKDLGATFNAVMQGSYYSHISVVVRGRASELVPLFPEDYVTTPTTNASEDVLCIFEVVPTRGVCLFPLEARLARTIDQIQYLSVRRHSGMITEQGTANLLAFMRQVKGRPLEILTLDMARSLFLHRLGKKYASKNKHENWDQFYCSELVAESLQQLGILRGEGFHSNDLVPASFSMPPSPTQLAQQGHPHAHRSFCFGEDEQITRPGHSYGVEQILIVPHNELAVALQWRKRILKQQYKDEKERLKQEKKLQKQKEKA